MIDILTNIQSDTSSVFSTIAAASTLTAQNTTLDSYDYWTITIAIVACIVSVASFYVAYMTLSSQRETERNTRNLSVDDLVKMLNHILEVAYINSIRSCALFKKMKDALYAEYPFANQVRYMRLPLDYILEEKCNDLSSNSYLQLVKLNRAISKYNEQLDFCFNTLKDGVLSTDIKKYEAKRLRYESVWLLCRISETIQLIIKENEVDDEIPSPFAVFTNTHEAFSQDAGNNDVQMVELPKEIVELYIQAAVVDEQDQVSLIKIVESDINILLGQNKRGEIYIPMIPVEN